MPRAPRMQSSFDLYHATARGAGRQIIFEDNDGRQYFLDRAKRVFDDNGASVLAYCLMSNHVHLLLQIDFGALPKAMKSVLSDYARWFNSKYGHVGHIFQGRYFSEPINDEAYLLDVVRYIHLNPQEAGIVQAGDYEWSSYHEYMSRAKICDTNFVLDLFGNKQAFVSFHEEDKPAPIRLTEHGRSGRLDDEQARKVADRIVSPNTATSLKTLTKTDRDEQLGKLLVFGFSIRQIERLTGIGRSVIYNASRKLP